MAAVVEGGARRGIVTEAECRREQRRLARARNHYLWRLVLDGRERRPAESRWEWEGPLPPACREELLALVRRWEKEGLI